MNRVIIPRPVRLICIWGAVFTFVFGFRCEMEYRAQVAGLPSLVDEHGNTASAEVAIAGLESYDRAKMIRKNGFVSFGIGVLLFAGAMITKHQKKEISQE